MRWFDDVCKGKRLDVHIWKFERGTGGDLSQGFAVCLIDARA